MKIAVTTPTGHIGSKLLNKLLEDGSHELILLARHAEKLTHATDKGAKVITGDLEDREYVTNATKGVDALFWVNPPKGNADDFIAYYRKLAANAAHAITTNDIPHVVFVSSVGAHIGKGVGPVDGLHDSEKILRDAANNLTILRPTFFMENFLMSASNIKSDNSLFLPVSGDARIPMIATTDIADAAYQALTHPVNGAAIVSLLGPRDYSFNEAADMIGKAIGRDISYTAVPPEDAKTAMMNMGMSEDTAGKMVEMYQAIDNGTMKPEKPRSAESTTPTKFEDFAQRTFPQAVR